MKKCWLTRRVPTRESLHKYLLLMKLTALFLLIACMQVSAKGYSQDKMSISLKDVKLKYAIAYIQHNSKYRFIYSDDLFPESAKVSVEARNATIQEVLDMVFRSTSLVYRVMNDNLIVIASRADGKAVFVVKGKESLHHTTGISPGSPGISVVEKGTTNGTTTNDQGEFSLQVKDGNAVLVISSVGYDRQEVAVDGKPELTILLEPTSAAMADVVVTAVPAGGESDDLFDEAMFAAMRPGCTFINVGRGNAVDEDALMAALNSGHLRAAAIDVARQEPLPADSPLWDTPNLYISPHASISQEGYMGRIWALFLDNLEAFEAGWPLRNVVNKHVAPHP